MNQGKDNLLILGVTGGIATGKTTVVNMLKEKGARVIDFDLLARRVVEPGKPAWKSIVAFFGEQVLREDGSLDRKKLADIVFGDPEKRKRIEEITHPEIRVEFARELNKIETLDPGAIILADVPLLIESSLQHMFQKIMVVYVPEGMQIDRLMAREGISREEALLRLKSQLPISDKVALADFVILNYGDLEGTRRQVDELWEKLIDLRKEKDLT